jgi:hypothetical protein
MTRRRTCLAATVLCLAVLGATFAQAAENVLALIPDGALGFAVVNRLAQADAKLHAFGKQIQQPIPSLLATAKQKTGVEKGLDEKGAAVLVMLAPGEADGEPVILLYVPVTDYQQFLAQLKPEDATADLPEVQVMGGPFLVGSRGGYAVFADPKHRDALKKALAAPSRVSKELAPLQKWLAENDAGIVVTRAGVEVLCGKVQAQIRKTREFLGSFGDESVKEQMKAAVAVFEIYEKFFKTAEENVQTYAAAVKIDGQGNVYLVSRLRGTRNGALAKALAEVDAPAGNLLAGFPAGPFVAAGGGVLPKGLMEGMIDFSIQMMKAAPQLYGLSDEQAGKLSEVSRLSMAGIRGMSMFLGVGKAGDPLLSNMVVTVAVEDSATYLKNYRKYLEAANELMKGAKGPMFSMMGGAELKEITIDGVSALELRMGIPKMPETVGQPGVETKMMEAFFGPGGKMVAYLAFADDHTVVMAYTSKESLLESLQAVKNAKAGLSGDAAVAKTTALLLPRPHWVGYWSPKGTVDFVARFIPKVAPEEAKPPKIPPFPETPPVGFAAKATKGELECQLVAPAATVAAIAQYVEQLQAMGGKKEVREGKAIGKVKEPEPDESP